MRAPFWIAELRLHHRVSILTSVITVSSWTSEICASRCICDRYPIYKLTYELFPVSLTPYLSLTSVCQFVGVGLKHWPTVYIAVIVLTRCKMNQTKLLANTSQQRIIIAFEYTIRQEFTLPTFETKRVKLFRWGLIILFCLGSVLFRSVSAIQPTPGSVVARESACTKSDEGRRGIPYLPWWRRSPAWHPVIWSSLTPSVVRRSLDPAQWPSRLISCKIERCGSDWTAPRLFALGITRSWAANCRIVEVERLRSPAAVGRAKIRHIADDAVSFFRTEENWRSESTTVSLAAGCDVLYEIFHGYSCNGPQNMTAL